MTNEGPGGTRFWPGGMKPGHPIGLSTDVLMLQHGENRVTFSAETAEGYPGDVNLLFYRLGPL